MGNIVKFLATWILTEIFKQIGTQNVFLNVSEKLFCWEVKIRKKWTPLYVALQGKQEILFCSLFLGKVIPAFHVMSTNYSLFRMALLLFQWGKPSLMLYHLMEAMLLQSLLHLSLKRKVIGHKHQLLQVRTLKCLLKFLHKYEKTHMHILSAIKRDGRGMKEGLK